MQTLTTLALIERTKHMNLQDTFEDLSKYPIGTATQSFWMKKLATLFEETLVKKRGDLLSKYDWEYFARSLMTGVQYRYGILYHRIRDATMGSWKLFPIRTVENNTHQYYTLEGKEAALETVVIDGLLPREGTKGILVTCIIDDEINWVDTYREVFFYKEGERNRALNLCKEYAASLILNRIEMPEINGVAYDTVDDVKTWLTDDVSETLEMRNVENQRFVVDIMYYNVVY